MRIATAMCSLSLAFALVAVATAPADAGKHRFRSKHPLPKKKGGFCKIDGPHAHDFGPHDRRVYRVVAGEYHFVGDPVAFGYDGPRYAFHGAHPVLDVRVEGGAPFYCYLDGPHYHGYQPPPATAFELHGGAYFYVGPFERTFHDHRPRYAAVNDAHRPIVYARPAIDVTVLPPHLSARVVVSAPAVRARVAAPPPAASVGVRFGVGLQVGGPTVVHERVVVREAAPQGKVKHKVKQDRGKHTGWYK